MDNDSHNIMEAFVYFGQKKLKKTENKDEGELMSHMKEKGMISKDASTDTGKYGKHREEEERRLDPSCWKGYHKQGTKMKGDKRVNNCVKNQDEEMPAPTFWDMLSKLKSKKEDVKTFADTTIDDLSKEDSREQFSAQDFAKDSERDMKMDDIRGENEEGLPSLNKFVKMLDRHDWTYQYSDDGSVYNRGAQEERDISNALEKGGKPYKDLYDQYMKNKGKVNMPEKSMEEKNQDSQAWRDLNDKLKDINYKLSWELDENSVVIPQQLWDAYYSIIYMLKQLKDIGEKKNYKTFLKSLSEHNIN